MIRFFDILFSSLGLFFLFPLFVIIITLLKFSGEGEIFYFQKRVGVDRKIFGLFKFATMLKNSEKIGTKTLTIKNDPRILPMGSFLRKTKINELPQLINVLKGDMSLIGPRPERPEIDKILISQISNYNLRYLVKPGISGWAQVNYPYGASVEDAKNKLSFDMFYIKNHSTIMDILIMLKTIRLVLNLRGSNPSS